MHASSGLKMGDRAMVGSTHLFAQTARLTEENLGVAFFIDMLPGWSARV